MKICEICSTKTFTDDHHIKSKSLGGSDSSYNIATVCPTCHRLIHRGVIVLEGRFLTTKGEVLFWHKNGEESITGETAEVFTY